MTVTLPEVPITGTIIVSSWGVEVRNALANMQSQVSAAAAAYTLEGTDTTDRTTTSTTKVTLSTISVSIPTNKHLEIRIPMRKSAGAVATASVGLKINTTVMLPPYAWFGSANQADSGYLIFRIAPRDATYLTCIAGEGSTLTGGYTQSAVRTASEATATITSVIIEGLVSSASITLGVRNVSVWSLPTS